MFGIVAIAAVAAAQSGMIAQSSSPPPVTVVSAPPLPVIAITPPAPPMVRTPQLSSGPPIPVRVRVAAGSQVLFNDALRVSRISGARYEQSRSEAPETVCSTERYYNSSQRSSVNLSLYLRDDTTLGSVVNVSVSWVRPSRAAACAEGTRQVQLTQTVPLAPGQSVTLQGDAGLTVSLSR